MRIDDEICLKFPAVLRELLKKGEIELPDSTLFDYEDILVYRVVEREACDCRAVTLSDFRSYFELNKTPKVPRGIKADYKKDPEYYGVSCFSDRDIVEQKMHFPRPGKKMAQGYVHKRGGPQNTKEAHVCWWLYENADIESFKLVD